MMHDANSTENTDRSPATADRPESSVAQAHAPHIALRPGQIRPSRYTFWLAALFLTLVSMGLQWGGLAGDAVIDDHAWLHDVSQRGCGLNAGDCFQHPQLRYYYRPLVGVSFALGQRLYEHSEEKTPRNGLVRAWLTLWSLGAKPDQVAPLPYAPPDSGSLTLSGAQYKEAFPYHIENLLQHGLAVLLVFWMFRLLFRRDLPALLGGLLFALHPLNVPVTTFIGGRTDNMALIFVALFVIGLLKMHMGSGEPEAAAVSAHYSPRPSSPDELSIPSQVSSLFWLFVSLLGFAGALFTKEQCVLLVMLAPLLATLASRRPGGRWLVWQSVYALPIAFYLWCAHRVALTVQQEDHTTHGARSFFAFIPWPLPEYIEMIGRTCWYYFCSFVFPTVSRMHQSTLGPWDDRALGPLGRSAPGVPLPPSPLLAVGGYVALFFALWLLRRTWADRACRVCLLWLFLTLLPCLNIVPVPSQFIAPYRALIPLVGLCGLAGAFFARQLDRLISHLPTTRPLLKALLVQPGAWLLIGTLLICCSGFVRVTLADVPQWKDDGILMQAEISADRNFIPAKFGEAYWWGEKGKLAEGKLDADNLSKAIASYDAGLHQLLPEAHTIDDYIRAGRARDIKHRIASASSLRYLDIPYLAGIFRARADLKQLVGRWGGAAEDYRAAYAIYPRDPSLGDWLAYALDHAGRWEEEETVLKKQIALRADSYRLSQLGSLYFRQKRWASARDTLKLALHSMPSETGSADLYTAQQQYNEAFVRALTPTETGHTGAGQ